MEIHQKAEENLKPGIKLIEVENMLKKLIETRGYGNFYVTGFTHGVGLLTEEDPITTIIAPHRQYKILENMVLVSIHAPLPIPRIGTIKIEDTYLIKINKPEKLTSFSYEPI